MFYVEIHKTLHKIKWKIFTIRFVQCFEKNPQSYPQIYVNMWITHTEREDSIEIQQNDNFRQALFGDYMFVFTSCNP